jgi:predicted nucleic acid-binding protein
VVVGSRRALYLDASAIVKLVIDESESPAVRERVAAARQLFTNRIAAVEVGRAVQRQSEIDASQQVSAVLKGLSMIELDPSVAESAATLEPRGLRSLDAIHLASALALGEELEAFVTYDLRLGEAARAAGLAVLAPA